MEEEANDSTVQLQKIIQPSEELQTSVKKDFKVYTKNEISIGTYFGGPLAGCYMLSKNFRNFGNIEFAEKTFKIGISSAMLFFIAILFIPEGIMNSIPKFIIPAIYTGIIYYYVDKFQGRNIEEYIKSGGDRYSAWKVFGVLLLSVVVLILYVFAVIILKVLIFG